MTRPDVAPLKEAGGIPGNPDEMGDPDPDPIHKSGNSKAQRKLLPGETLGWAEGGGGWRRVAEGGGGEGNPPECKNASQDRNGSATLVPNRENCHCSHFRCGQCHKSDDAASHR